MVAADYGRIVNLGSVAGKEGNPFSAAYSASKAAVISLTKSMAQGARQDQRARQLRRAGDHRDEEPVPRHAGGDAQAVGVARADGTAGHAGGGRRDDRVARLGGMLVHDRRRVRPLRRPRDVLGTVTETNPAWKVLAGYRVIEHGEFITGPYTAMLLGRPRRGRDQGRAPGRGDPFRSFEKGLYGPQFQAFNRNKRSIQLDLEADADRAR